MLKVLILLVFLCINLSLCQTGISLSQTDATFSFNGVSNLIYFILPVPADMDATREIYFSTTCYNFTADVFISKYASCATSSSCYNSDYLAYDTTPVIQKKSLYLAPYVVATNTYYIIVKPTNGVNTNMSITIQTVERKSKLNMQLATLTSSSFNDTWTTTGTTSQVYNVYVPADQSSTYDLFVTLETFSGSVALYVTTSSTCSTSSNCYNSDYALIDNSAATVKKNALLRINTNLWYIVVRGQVPSTSQYRFTVSLVSRAAALKVPIQASATIQTYYDSWYIPAKSWQQYTLNGQYSAKAIVTLSSSTSLDMYWTSSTTCASSSSTYCSSYNLRDVTTSNYKTLPSSSSSSCYMDIPSSQNYIAIYNPSYSMATYSFTVQSAYSFNCSSIDPNNPNNPNNPSNPSKPLDPATTAAGIGIIVAICVCGALLFISLVGYIVLKVYSQTLKAKQQEVPAWVKVLEVIFLVPLIIAFVLSIVGLFCVLIFCIALARSNNGKVVVVKYVL